ncbi:MAG: hypothetical protein R6X02_26445 [Enhygromyxa sp.]
MVDEYHTILDEDRDASRPSRWWMRLLGSVWITPLAVLGGAGVFGWLAYAAPPVGAWSWARLALLCFGPPIGLSLALYLLIGRALLTKRHIDASEEGDTPCHSCGRMNQATPRPPMVPGMSEPHLRCRHCGSIIWGA